MRVTKSPEQTEPLHYDGSPLREVSEFRYLGFLMNTQMTSKGIAKTAATVLDINISQMKRWCKDVENMAPFPMLKEILQSKIRGSIAGYLPFITQAETLILEKKEARLWRHVLNLSFKHPSLALYAELDITPLTAQRKIAMHNMKDRLGQYAADTAITFACYLDKHALAKKYSWHQRLPPLPSDGLGKSHYKSVFRGEYEHERRAKLELATLSRGTSTQRDAKASYLTEWLAVGREPRYWRQRNPIRNISLVTQLRASCLGLGHNHSYLNAGLPTCRLCNNGEIEDELHLMMVCDRLRTRRTAIVCRYRWTARDVYETIGEQYIRVVRNMKTSDLASCIRFMLKARRELLAEIGE